MEQAYVIRINDIIDGNLEGYDMIATDKNNAYDCCAEYINSRSYSKCGSDSGNFNTIGEELLFELENSLKANEKSFGVNGVIWATLVDVYKK